MQTQILVVGFNLPLLETRAEILNSLNLHSATACSVHDALTHLEEKHFDLLFLCHTVNPDSTRELIRQVNRRYPSIKIARLHLGMLAQDILAVVDADIALDYDPASWILVLDSLLAEATWGDSRPGMNP